jgi:hypothetical protein
MRGQLQGVRSTRQEQPGHNKGDEEKIEPAVEKTAKEVASE